MRVLLMLLAVVAMAAIPAAAQQGTAEKPAKPAAADASKPAAPATAVVNLNTATQAQLESLPGLGPKVAERILEYRQKNGAFKKVEEILETSRFCPYSLSVFDLGCLPSVSGSR